MPCFPLFPGEPMIPLSPLSPVLPLCPLRPRAPFCPLGPGGPGGPGGPAKQLPPFDWQSCSLPSDKSLLILSIMSAVFLALVVFLGESALRLYLLRLEDMNSKNNKHSLETDITLQAIHSVKLTVKLHWLS